MTRSDLFYFTHLIKHSHVCPSVVPLWRLNQMCFMCKKNKLKKPHPIVFKRFRLLSQGKTQGEELFT